MRRIGTLVVAGAIGFISLAVVASSADAALVSWKNCTAVNQRLPHGVGRIHAHDRTSGTPVTNFRHNNALYRTAMDHNSDLDRDRDGIACEKA